MLSTTREKRSNAGNRMAQLLEDEEADDFYTSAYGGFQEEEDDAEFSEEPESEEETDSDISIDENDEPISDEETEQKSTKRKSRVVTKAYTEPAKFKAKKEVKKMPSRSSGTSISVENLEKKRMRDSTTQKSMEVRLRQAAGALKNQDQQKRKSVESHAMTQEQLLEEAKITELKNLKSLEMFQRLELEKKKTKLTKRTNLGPMIKYHSVTMPAIEIIENEHGVEESKVVGNCSRNFVTFPDEETMKSFFKFQKPKPVERSTCIVTRLPARYFDPLTKQPSANLAAYRIIREAYYAQLEKKVDPRVPHVAKWLEWRKQMRAAKQGPKTIKTSH